MIPVGMVFYDLTDEELCDLMCGSPEIDADIDPDIEEEEGEDGEELRDLY